VPGVGLSQVLTPGTTLLRANNHTKWGKALTMITNFDKTGFVIIVVALSCLNAIGANSTAQEHEEGNYKGYSLSWTGKMMTVHRDGDASPRMDLDALAPKTASFAIGPLSGLRGEITVVDGEVYITRIVDGKEHVEQIWDHQAPFLVYGRVEEWKEVEMPKHITEISQLEQWLSKAARAHGIDSEDPFPFKLTVSDSKIDYHVIANEAQGYMTTVPHRELMRFFELENQPATLIGVYSTKHAGIFTHHGSSTHIHMVSHDKRHSGHVDSLELGIGTRLFLPVPKK
jgi:acetolactate decarboxylase